MSEPHTETRWSSEQLATWVKREGFSHAHAALKLGVSVAHLRKVLYGQSRVSAAMQAAAERWSGEVQRLAAPPKASGRVEYADGDLAGTLSTIAAKSPLDAERELLALRAASGVGLTALRRLLPPPPRQTPACIEFVQNLEEEGMSTSSPGDIVDHYVAQVIIMKDWADKRWALKALSDRTGIPLGDLRRRVYELQQEYVRARHIWAQKQHIAEKEAKNAVPPAPGIIELVERYGPDMAAAVEGLDAVNLHDMADTFGVVPAVAYIVLRKNGWQPHDGGWWRRATG